MFVQCDRLLCKTSCASWSCEVREAARYETCHKETVAMLRFVRFLFPCSVMCFKRSYFTTVRISMAIMAGLQDHRAGRTVLVDLAFWKPGKQHTNMSIRLPMDRAQPTTQAARMQPTDHSKKCFESRMIPSS